MSNQTKYIILLGDGMADFPVAALGDKTPLEAARTPGMDRLANEGICGMFNPISGGLPAGSDVGNLSCFGYDPTRTYTGRAPIEAASRGIPLGPNDIALRCNLVTVSDSETMESFTAGHISSDEGAEIIAALNAEIDGFPIQFHNGVGYRHLGVYSADPAELEALNAVQCTPPHNIAEQPIADYLPNGPGAERFRALMDASRPVLADHPVNKKRISEGKLPATTIWIWGQGRTPTLPSYRDEFNLGGSVISAVDIVKGIGRLAGLDIIDVPGATGYLDTDYEGKVSAALGSLADADFTYIHVEAPDETAHEGRADLKVQAIEDFDARVVGPCLEYAAAHAGTRILVCPDHITAIHSKAHEDGPVPFAMCGAGIAPNGVAAYTEADAQASGINVDPGFQLVRTFLTQPSIDPTRLTP